MSDTTIDTDRLREAAGLPSNGSGELPNMPERNLTLDVGGEAPDTSTIVLAGGSIGLGAKEFHKGDVVEVRVRAVVNKVSFIDKTGKETDEVIGTERRHAAKITALEVL